MRAKLEAERVAYEKARELQSVLKSFETVDDDARRSTLLDSLCSTDDILNLPIHEDPPSLEKGELNTNLMKHQLQALKWMIDKEYPALPTNAHQPPVQVNLNVTMPR
jgi:SWI/SNF-related matrix-associated actin-dependent regulator of chromatin subfamily A3